MLINPNLHCLFETEHQWGTTVTTLYRPYTQPFLLYQANLLHHPPFLHFGPQWAFLGIKFKLHYSFYKLFF